MLQITRSLIAEARRGAGTESDDEEPLSLRKLMQMRDVLEQGGGFSGINRKLQLKPLAWEPRYEGSNSEDPSFASADASAKSLGEPADASDMDTVRDTPHTQGRTRQRRGEGAGARNGVDETVTEALLVLKWGGVLTDGGREQAVQLGTLFRHMMYPGESEGFLRLHSTYRHDLKIYASDEGRVQSARRPARERGPGKEGGRGERGATIAHSPASAPVTAAAFAKGFLDLEGPLTPILASLVRSGRDATKVHPPPRQGRHWRPRGPT